MLQFAHKWVEQKVYLQNASSNIYRHIIGLFNGVDLNGPSYTFSQYEVCLHHVKPSFLQTFIANNFDGHTNLLW